MAEMSNLDILANMAISHWPMRANMAEMSKCGIMANLDILANMAISHWPMMGQHG